MKEYLEIVRKILDKGELKKNRTGIDTISIAGAMFEHDMSEGFPLLTTKKMAHKSIRVELEGFIKGITDKKWYQDRGCRIWDEWCNPQKVMYGHDDETKRKMFEERDLGPIYGFQWRHFDAPYINFDSDYTGKGVDQLANILNSLKNNPNDRRMVINAWNPQQLNQMALPPCHYAFQVTVINDKLNLLWAQRSVDTMIGLPFNIASYGFLLHLLAKESGFKEGKLVGFLGDVHIYLNHIKGVEEQIKREPYGLSKVVTDNFNSLFNWEHNMTKIVGYKSHDKIEFPLAI
ncbi:MAG: thymidylate synthase [Candidatus Pacearchaeota archaeon]